MDTASLEPKTTECPVCHEYYTEPKILPCAHLLCRDCLVSWMKTNSNAQCPLCCNNIRDPTSSLITNCADVVDQMPTDEMMAEMIENFKILNQNRVCYVHKDVNAKSFCLHCSMMLCPNCVEVHSTMPLTATHKLETLEKLTLECMTSSRQSPCLAHPEKVSELFCSTHEILICHLCAFSKHRACPEVSCITELMEKSKLSLSDMEKRLGVMESALSQAVTDMEKHFVCLEQNTKDSLTQIDAACDRLVLSIENCRIRLKKLVQDENDNIMAGVNQQKDVLVQKRGVITSHRSLINRIQLSASCTSMVSMVPRLNKRVSDLEINGPLQSDLESCAIAKLTIDEEVISRIELELAGLCQLNVIIAEKQGVWRFHTNHGKSIVLRNNGMTAESTGGGYGLVFSKEALKVNMLYEIRVDEINTQYNGRHVGFGLVTQDPALITDLLMYGNGLQSAIIVYHSDVYIKQKQIQHHVDVAYNTFKVGSRIGVLVDAARCLHIYVDGKDQGVVCREVPMPCWAVFDLYLFLKKVTVLTLSLPLESKEDVQSRQSAPFLLQHTVTTVLYLIMLVLSMCLTLCQSGNIPTALLKHIADLILTGNAHRTRPLPPVTSDASSERI